MRRGTICLAGRERWNERVLHRRAQRTKRRQPDCVFSTLHDCCWEPGELLGEALPSRVAFIKASCSLTPSRIQGLHALYAQRCSCPRFSFIQPTAPDTSCSKHQGAAAAEPRQWHQCLWLKP